MTSMRGSLLRSSADVLVRLATAADLERVKEIDQATEGVSHWRMADYEKYECEPRSGLFHRCLLVAVDGAAVIGFAAGSFLEGDEPAVLENLAVDAEWRRKGVASALCGAFAEWARGVGASGMSLEVRAANEGARVFYEGLGLSKSGMRKGYYSHPKDDAVLMALRFG